jgi:uncharacterized protein DUF4159
MTRRLIAVTLALSLAAAGAAAQQRWGRLYRAPPRFPSADSFDGTFNFCRGMFTSNRPEAGGQGWWTDYPDADINFSIRLSELTKTRVSKARGDEPNHLVVRLTDDALFQCPYLHMEDVGTMLLSDAEILRLRQYLLKGGFLWVDDFWGNAAWEQWVDEISRVLSPVEFPIRDLSHDHPIWRAMFQIKELPQIPSINFWSRSGGETSEREWESAEPHIRGISDSHGRLMVLMTHNTDISDAWEREGEDPRYFYLFSPNGYAVGINVIMYAMTH